ncbi:hypothetical protein EW146_g8520 [Bondarzewia mesenterica]|uniref:Uncharacterized protein n=1 Tax=Bondarzewia mesenterica TaxID=1095465 RepID=A0A4S4LFI7_9AGAM|nr:hypothetical protein EW146_g8520 [Bondarzewia mesenterica]
MQPRPIPPVHLTTPDPFVNSPGSSVFDLPTQNAPLSQNHSQSRLFISQASDASEGANVPPSFMIISGGTGCNAICSAFSHASYVLPVSDDGGSSSEIIRVLGGPSIGDIRSRLVRLIPPAPHGSPLDALRTLLAYRLPVHCSEAEARDEWRSIVEGRSALWTGIPNDRKETIRGDECRYGYYTCIGNYFLAAAQGFFRSLPSAIFLFSSITNSQANILPVIVTNHTVTIAAELINGTKLVGQCEISHPVHQSSFGADQDSFIVTNDEDLPSATEDSNPMVAKRENVVFEADSKEEFEALDAPVSRLYYINTYGHEIHPTPNPDYLVGLKSKEVLVYSCGSLWTSIVPCLALRGVASAIAGSSTLRAKVLFLNSKNDRETNGYTAVDYINAIVRTLNARYGIAPYGLGHAVTIYPVSAFITHLVYLGGAAVPVDVRQVTALGVQCVRVESDIFGQDGVPLYDAACARSAIEEILSKEE